MRSVAALYALSIVAVPLHAQPSCPPTPAFSTCELVFDLDSKESAAHPSPAQTVSLRVEFRSPRHRTLLLPGYWDGGARMIVRFAPTEPGEWEFRVTSNISRFNNQVSKVEALPSDNPGFIRAANVHHWAYSENNRPHLWMGDTIHDFAGVNSEIFNNLVDLRAKQGFNHIRGWAFGSGNDVAARMDDPAFLRTLQERIRHMNERGIVCDLVLIPGAKALQSLLPSAAGRERFAASMVARFSALNVTWQMAGGFEDDPAGRDLLKELGGLIKKLDPYQHPRSVHTTVTSSPLLADGWMDHVVYESASPDLGAIEHQLYAVPFVNTRLIERGDANAFRKRLWEESMNGAYPTLTNGELESAEAKMMSIWFEFFSKTRHWELEPYFDVDGGRAMALPGVEYILYVDKPGPVEVRVERHGYDVRWFNPATGESVAQKEWKGEKFAAEPPDQSHDWVLHLSRDGRKESMLRSYKFESRPVLMQEIENTPAKIPFEIADPASQEIARSKPQRFQARLKRETRGTRAMQYLWTGEIGTSGQGFRILGTGVSGTLSIPAAFGGGATALLNLRVYGMNANGKVYSIDRVYNLAP